MKRLWLSLLIVALMAAAALVNVRYLGRLTGELAQTLETAQQHAEKGDAERAIALTSQAEERFSAHSFYLHITLTHQDIDSIESAFRETLEHLRLGETALYAVSNSRLLTQLALLSEAEQLTLENIL